MNTTQISIHGITQVEFKPRSGASFNWVNITVLQQDGSETELTFFFDKDHQREMFLEQIGLKVLA